jgi:hypothetical protein
MMKDCIEGTPGKLGQYSVQHAAAIIRTKDYSEVLPRLQRVRGPRTLEAALPRTAGTSPSLAGEGGAASFRSGPRGWLLSDDYCS